MPVNANTEYKMSALLTALQEFDTAIEQQNVRSARQALEIDARSPQSTTGSRPRFGSRSHGCRTWRSRRLRQRCLSPLRAAAPAGRSSASRTAADARVFGAARAAATGPADGPGQCVACSGGSKPAAAAASAPAQDAPKTEHTFSGGDATSLFGGLTKAHPIPAAPPPSVPIPESRNRLPRRRKRRLGLCHRQGRGPRLRPSRCLLRHPLNPRPRFQARRRRPHNRRKPRRKRRFSSLAPSLRY